MMGWTIHTTTMKHSTYGQTLDAKAHSRVNEYENVEEIFEKENY